MKKYKANEILFDIDPTTVIDDNWEDYLKEDKKTLNALKKITGLDSYDKIHRVYEGYTISQILELFTKK